DQNRPERERHPNVHGASILIERITPSRQLYQKLNPDDHCAQPNNDAKDGVERRFHFDPIAR
ncbi:MAG: hypothetical protein ACREPP_09975, partial [Rhodanobacteraceae bacterium]